MNNSITDSIASYINNPDSLVQTLKDVVSGINISPNITNPTIDLSNSPYVKYGMIFIILGAIYFFFIKK
jgi:hypothetical protein